MPELRIRPATSFLDYAPVSLTFGTSGLRGLVKDITDLEAYINVKAALRYLLSIGDIHASSGVVIAGDLRPSTDRIMRACAQAIVDLGCQVENAGKIPTPALISHAISARRAGVMVSGSHIPFDRNGIKLNKSVGEVLKQDEPGITREVERVRVEEYSRTATKSAFDASGMLKQSPDLPPIARAAEEAYVRRYLNSFTCGGLSGLHVLVYQHSAVGRDILPRILRELGAEVVTAGRSETFVSIDTENITDEQVNRLEELAVAAEASGRPVHAIVSTDGDSDRPLLTAVLTAAEVHPGGRRVRFLPGDLLGIVVAEYLRAAGYRVFPVNPEVGRPSGDPAYPSLQDIPLPIDVVTVFRRPEFIPAVVEAALAVAAKALWLQDGVVHPEAAQRAEAAGLRVVMDRCIRRDHRRLLAGSAAPPSSKPLGP